jgi:hypothetical protein
MLSSYLGYSQTPEIGHFQQLATVKRGDTLDVAWYYKPAAGTDVRTFQVDWQFKKTLFTYLSTTVDNTVTNNSPVVNYQTWDGYKYSNYLNGMYNYVVDTNWTVGRNYLILSNGNSLSSNGYIIHNKFKINNVSANYVADTITLNWARMFKVDGTTIGDNVANLSYNKLAIKLLGNLTISGKVFLPSSVTSSGLIPTINCYDNVTNVLVSSTTPNATTGNYTLNNIDENKRYRIELRFPTDSLASLRDRAVTISDAVKSYNEYSFTDVNQTFGRQYLKHGLSYLIGDINLSGALDGGDPYGIYASVSGLRPIDTTKLINVFKKDEYDSLVLGVNQWTTWSSYSNRGISVTDSVTTNNLTLDLKYFILGDVDRTHSSPVFNPAGVEVTAAIFGGNYGITIPNSYAVGQPMYVPFNVSTNGGLNNGLQFEMKYDITKVKFEEIVSNIQGPWLQYVTHDEQNGIIRFGGMNNQKSGSLQGEVTPFKLKFSAKVAGEDISTYVFVRKLMDASDLNGDHFNIALTSDRVLLTYRAASTLTFVNSEPTAVIRPNPNNGIFELVITIPNNSWMTASIYDYSGKKLLDLGRYQTDEFNNTFTKRVDVQSLAQGAYLIVLSNDKKQITKPFIKS